MAIRHPRDVLAQRQFSAVRATYNAKGREGGKQCAARRTNTLLLSQPTRAIRCMSHAVHRARAASSALSCSKRAPVDFARPLQATQQMMASAGGYGSQPPAYGAYGNPYGYGAPPAGPGYGGYAVPNAGGYGAAALASGGHYYAPPRY